MPKLVWFLGFALQVTASYTPAEVAYFNVMAGIGCDGSAEEILIDSAVIDGTGIDILPLLSEEKLLGLESAFMEVMKHDD